MDERWPPKRLPRADVFAGGVFFFLWWEEVELGVGLDERTLGVFSSATVVSSDDSESLSDPIDAVGLSSIVEGEG